MTILEYKQKYFDDNACPPGEHHFVAVYLLEKFNFIPDYINPDGEKNIPGDIVFCNKEKDKIISFEVKVTKKNKKSFTFTAKQFNEWFVYEKKIPDYLIALTQNYIFIINFSSFIEKYKMNNKVEQIQKGKKRNSSTFSEDCLKQYCSDNESITLVGENISEEDINQKIRTFFDKFNKEIKNVYK